MAIRQSGHAVVQTLVGRGRFSVARVSLDGEHGGSWRGLPARGVSSLDREVHLGLYEFGLVTLAGIAAENHYLARRSPVEDPLVALSDLAEWQEKAWEVLQDEARIRLVGLNVMRKLKELLAGDAIWRVVEQLAETLLECGTLQGQRLERILAPLTGEHAER